MLPSTINDSVNLSTMPHMHDSDTCKLDQAYMNGTLVVYCETVFSHKRHMCQLQSSETNHYFFTKVVVPMVKFGIFLTSMLVEYIHCRLQPHVNIYSSILYLGRGIAGTPA